MYRRASYIASGQSSKCFQNLFTILCARLLTKRVMRKIPGGKKNRRAYPFSWNVFCDGKFQSTRRFVRVRRKGNIRERRNVNGDSCITRGDRARKSIGRSLLHVKFVLYSFYSPITDQWLHHIHRLITFCSVMLPSTWTGKALTVTS